jgi:hypothetical protein
VDGRRPDGGCVAERCEQEQAGWTAGNALGYQLVGSLECKLALWQSTGLQDDKHQAHKTAANDGKDENYGTSLGPVFYWFVCSRKSCGVRMFHIHYDATREQEPKAHSNERESPWRVLVTATLHLIFV